MRLLTEQLAGTLRSPPILPDLVQTRDKLLKIVSRKSWAWNGGRFELLRGSHGVSPRETVVTCAVHALW